MGRFKYKTPLNSGMLGKHSFYESRLLPGARFLNFHEVVVCAGFHFEGRVSGTEIPEINNVAKNFVTLSRTTPKPPLMEEHVFNYFCDFYWIL